MNGWWGVLLMGGISFVIGFAQAFHSGWTNEDWVKAANEEAGKIGLPPATHLAKKWGRTISVKAIDPDTGKWLWKSDR